MDEHFIAFLLKKNISVPVYCNLTDELQFKWSELFEKSKTQTGTNLCENEQTENLILHFTDSFGAYFCVTFVFSWHHVLFSDAVAESWHWRIGLIAWSQAAGTATTSDSYPAFLYAM